MIPASFEYVRASSLADAISLLSSADGAKLLAGGHSLLPAMRLRVARPTTLVDIGRLQDLSYVRADGDGIAVGALTRHHDVAASDVLRALCPIVAAAAEQIGDPQVRHMGTIGGSVAHADPAGDMPSVLLALDAQFVVAGPGGIRTIEAHDLFTSLFETSLLPDEVLTEIRVPRATAGWSYVKFNRRAQDWALVGVAAVAGPGGARVALTNMGLTPLRARGVEEELARDADPTRAAERAAEGTAPPSDAFASDDYRRRVVKVLVRRALEETLS